MYGESKLKSNIGIEESDLNFETSSIDDTENLRLEIEKLRAATEDQILKLREEYLQQEAEILKELTNDQERKQIMESRPDFLFSETSALDDHKNFEYFSDKDTSKRMPWSSPFQEISPAKPYPQDLSPLKDFEKNRFKIKQDDEDFELENRIKSEMEKEFKQTEKELKKEYDEKIDKAVHDVEIKLNQYWESRAQELEDKIKALEDTKPKSAKEIDQKYQEYYEELLEKEKEELAEELEGKIREKYENLLQQELNNSNGLDYETQNQIKEEMEYAFQQRLRDEKQAWQAEVEANFMHELRKKSEFSLKNQIEAVEEMVKKDATDEINRKISEIKKEADEKITRYIADSQKKDIEAAKQVFKAEYKQKLKLDQENTLKSLLDPKVKLQIEQELRKELTEKLEKEIYEECETNLKSKVRAELSDLYKNRQKQLRLEMKNKLKHAEERLTDQYKAEIEQQVNDIIARREKELIIDYKKQLERNKREIEAHLTKEFEAKHFKEREALNDELAEITKTKALLMAQLKTVKLQKKDELDRIKKQREEINEKIQELGHTERNPEIKQTPHPTKPSLFSDCEDFDTNEKLHVFNFESDSMDKLKKNSPFLIENQESNLDKPPSPIFPDKIETEQPKRRLLPKYNTQDLLNQILSQNTEETKKAYKLLEETQEPPTYYRKLIDYSNKNK
jgi:hypothetical protein